MLYMKELVALVKKSTVVKPRGILSMKTQRMPINRNQYAILYLTLAILSHEK